MMAQLTEGMHEGDLADLVLPLISVDEFVSKVDPSECIVFGFYVHDHEAANDLNRFLQKSAVPILDTEVSPAPDQHGYFMVFVEIMRNRRLEENVTSILAEIKSLVNIDEWQMRVRKLDELVPFSEQNLRDSLNEIVKKDKHKDVLEFLSTSALSDVLFEDDLIILESYGERHAHWLLAFDRIDVLMQKAEVSDAPIAYGMRSIARMNKIAHALGEGWDVSNVGKHILLHNAVDPRGLLLEPNRF
jgi:hypothetical protein